MRCYANQFYNLFSECISYMLYCICAVTVMVFLFHCFHGISKRCRKKSKTGEITLEVGDTSNPDSGPKNIKDKWHSSSAVQENTSFRMSSVYQSLIPSATERQSVYESLDQGENQFTDIYESCE